MLIPAGNRHIHAPHVPPTPTTQLRIWDFSGIAIRNIKSKANVPVVNVYKTLQSSCIAQQNCDSTAECFSCFSREKLVKVHAPNISKNTWKLPLWFMQWLYTLWQKQGCWLFVLLFTLCHLWNQHLLSYIHHARNLPAVMKLHYICVATQRYSIGFINTMQS